MESFNLTELLVPNVSTPTLPHAAMYPYQREYFITIKILAPVWPAIVSFGLVSNVTNIVVFLKAGIKENVTILLLSLAVSDLLFLALITPSTSWYVIQALVGSYAWPFDSWLVRYLLYWPAYTAYDLSALISVSLGVMRCACVAMPLKFKLVFTRSRTAKWVLVLVVLSVLLRLPVLTVHRVARRTHPATNISSLYMTSVNSAYMSRINDILNRGIVIYLCYITMVTCVVVLTYKLYEAAKVRRSATGKVPQTPDQTSEKPAAHTLSTKDVQVVTSVVLVCTIFILSQLSFLVSSTMRRIIPEFDTGKRLMFLFGIFSQISRTCSYLNASLNIFVYYKYNSGGWDNDNDNVIDWYNGDDNDDDDGDDNGDGDGDDDDDDDGDYNYGDDDDGDYNYGDDDDDFSNNSKKKRKNSRKKSSSADSGNGTDVKRSSKTIPSTKEPEVARKSNDSKSTERTSGTSKQSGSQDTNVTPFLRKSTFRAPDKTPSVHWYKHNPFIFGGILQSSIYKPVRVPHRDDLTGFLQPIKNQWADLSHIVTGEYPQLLTDDPSHQQTTSGQPQVSVSDPNNFRSLEPDEDEFKDPFLPYIDGSSTKTTSQIEELGKGQFEQAGGSSKSKVTEQNASWIDGLYEANNSETGPAWAEHLEDNMVDTENYENDGSASLPWHMPMNQPPQSSEHLGQVDPMSLAERLYALLEQAARPYSQDAAQDHSSAPNWTSEEGRFGNTMKDPSAHSIHKQLRVNPSSPGTKAKYIYTDHTANSRSKKAFVEQTPIVSQSGSKMKDVDSGIFQTSLSGGDPNSPPERLTSSQKSQTSPSFPFNRPSTSGKWRPPSQVFYESQRASLGLLGRRSSSKVRSKSSLKSVKIDSRSKDVSEKPSKSTGLPKTEQPPLATKKLKGSNFKFPDDKPRSKNVGGTTSSPSANYRSPNPEAISLSPQPTIFINTCTGSPSSSLDATRAGPNLVQESGDDESYLATLKTVNTKNKLGLETLKAPEPRKKRISHRKPRQDGVDGVCKCEPLSSSARGNPLPPVEPGTSQPQGLASAGGTLNSVLSQWTQRHLGLYQYDSFFEFVKFLLLKLITVWFLSTFFHCMRDQGMHHHTHSHRWVNSIRGSGDTKYGKIGGYV
ncbi:chemosensory receptor B [Elysia marginata]|uniref:Chemosensory receptor B n=1 Tax=Elysia marginata TaxID=1093978 RepID=A0AAV4FIJ1_9GAST|nr:chemosensory receptor B [Elysia marginata]